VPKVCCCYTFAILGLFLSLCYLLTFIIALLRAALRDGKNKLSVEEQHAALLESLLFVIALRTTQTQLLLNVRTLDGQATSLQIKHSLEVCSAANVAEL